ncbi:MAG: DNA phosphorothioation-associated protein 4 [Bacteroidota bacterium]
MGDTRIKIAKDKAELVKALRKSDDTTGPFQTYVDILVFAASLGFAMNQRVPLTEVSKKDPDPIPRDHFTNRDYNQVINLIAIASSQDAKVVAESDERVENKIRIFEEYANAGLEILKSRLAGSVDHTNQLLLLLDPYIGGRRKSEDEFDLTSFL